MVDKGTFGNPSVNVRPKFRYWTPDASVDLDTVADDVQAAGDIGAAGLELLGYYLYGGPPSNGAGRGDSAPVDWATYGFGTPAWRTCDNNIERPNDTTTNVLTFVNHRQSCPSVRASS